MRRWGGQGGAKGDGVVRKGVGGGSRMVDYEGAIMKGH